MCLEKSANSVRLSVHHRNGILLRTTGQRLHVCVTNSGTVMGCRPSRHSSGRVGDISWQSDKGGYFRHDSKKRKRMKNGCISQRKPAVFSEFSSTSKTYQKITRNVSQCSKITLRLSTDGSTLEIEKYDIDFHSNKEELLTKNTEWCSSQETSIGKINGLLAGKAHILRCESAPQLTFLPLKLNTILEDGEDSERLKFRLFPNGFKAKSLRCKSKGKIKHSKTFANGTSRSEAVENDLVQDQRNITVGKNSEFGKTVDNDRNGTFSEQQKMAVFDLVSDSSDVSCFETSKEHSTKSQTTLCTANNSKSICDEGMLIENTPQNYYIGCSSNLKSSSKVCDTDQTNNDNADANICNADSEVSFKEKRGHSGIHVDLRTEVYNSINRFNELLLIRQQAQYTNIQGPDLDNETMVSVHNSDSSQLVETNSQTVLTPSSTEYNASLQDVEETVHNHSNADPNIVGVKGMNDLENENNINSSTTQKTPTNHIGELDNQNGNISIEESESFPADPPTQLSKSDINETSCHCNASAPGSNISHDSELCKCCCKTEYSCKKSAHNNAESCQRMYYCAITKGATDSLDTDTCNDKLQSRFDEKSHKSDDLQTNITKEGTECITAIKKCNNSPNGQIFSRCDKSSIKNGTILTGISQSNVQSQDSCDLCGELTTVATDKPLQLRGAVLTKKIDDEATALCVKASMYEKRGKYDRACVHIWHASGVEYAHSLITSSYKLRDTANSRTQK